MKNILQLLILGAILLVSCSNNSESISDSVSINNRYIFTPRQKSDTTATVSVELTGQAGDSITFLLPPIYADNPMLASKSNFIDSVIVRNQNGEIVSHSTTTIDIDGHSHNAIKFLNNSINKISYDINFTYDTTTFEFTHFPIPTVSKTGGYILGNYVFGVPYNGETLVDLWRNYNPFLINYNLPQGTTLYGDPNDGWDGKNFYELFFSQSLINGNLLLTNSDGIQPFQIVSPTATTLNNSDTVESMMKMVLDECCAMFGVIDKKPISLILDVDPAGGLEGDFAFSAISTLIDTIQPILSALFVHEIIHFWVGVRTGETTDPWWKEATTNYLGYLISARLGLCDSVTMFGTLFANLSNDNSTKTVALSDPLIRARLYEVLDSNKFTNLVYGKGAQVNMLLDARIRNFSKGKKGIEDVVIEITKKFGHSAFFRSYYISEIYNNTGYDPTTFFEEYIDKPGVIPLDTLQNAYEILDSYDAFGKMSRREYQPRNLASHVFNPHSLF